MKKLFLICAFVFMTTNAFGVTPVKLSLWNEIAAPHDDTLHGIEIGIGSYTPNMVGFMFDFLVGKTDNAAGIQIAMITIAAKMAGIQCGFININYDEIIGSQVGLFNNAERVKGLQIGVFNFTDEMTGIQLGLFNYIGNGKIITESFPAMLIFNANF
ncbi:MAG: hypothetical protein LBV16_04590 [Elusimicrobiota bacterium]|jgi:hypothetical protein|nr:hypothetical protein [Elusimicrobiota bacterium]